ncbi:DUF4959 domain-containing protein [Maribacter sp. 2304DJ31-5]|uniref:DUF4959 domain-containing protein n=1 Tax=Maribacter sp. 2304DJ31-5 TaxID=3386273 RepID=UPI0039BD2C99
MKKILSRALSMLMVCALVLLFSCEEEAKGSLTSDGVAPDAVSDVQITPIAGGARVSYKLPAQDDVLFVRADYVLPSGETTSLNASLYVNEIDILGFIDTEKEVTASLTVVDQGGNESSPVQVSFMPLEPPVTGVAQNLEILPDFGGIRLKISNPTEARLTFTTYTFDENNEPLLLGSNVLIDEVPLDPIFFRGFDPEPRDFEVRVTDRWNNEQVVQNTVTPIEEVLIPKEGFSHFPLPHDAPLRGGGTHPLSNMFDDNLGTFGWTLDQVANTVGFDPNPLPEYTNPFNPGNVTAHLMTFDMGESAILSRFVYHNLRPWHGYSSVTWRLIDIWVTNEEPNAEGTLEGWTKVVEDHEFLEPDDHVPAVDNPRIHEEGLEVLLPPVQARYIRIALKRNYLAILTSLATEIEVYGTIVE